METTSIVLLLDLKFVRLLTRSLIKVTAVHPDYVLRSDVLREMKSRWYSTTADGTISVILGLLRDGQYELALEKLEEWNRGHLPKPAWLYHIFVYVFGELGFHNESYQILQHLLRVYGPNQPMAIWQFLLDVYSRDAYYMGISYIWQRMVVPGLLNPPDGTALNVLNVASRHGDAELVTSVMKMFTDRGKRLEMHHYEALIHAHTLHGDVRKAFNVLCVTGRAGLAPDSSSTRSIYRLLRGSSATTNEALGVLQDLSALYPIPIAAFNVVLEATLAHGGFRPAMDLYRSVRSICTAGPDVATYHVLLRECTMRKFMRFLLEEMDALGIRLEPATYDHAIRISTLQKDYERAFWYLRKMTRAGEAAAGGTGSGNTDHERRRRWWMSRPTALALIRRCVQNEDPLVVPVVEGCRERGMDVEEDVRRLVRKARQDKEEREARGIIVQQPGEGQEQEEQQSSRPWKLDGDKSLGLKVRKKKKKKNMSPEEGEPPAEGGTGVDADQTPSAASAPSREPGATTTHIVPPPPPPPQSERPAAGSMGG